MVFSILISTYPHLLFFSGALIPSAKTEGGQAVGVIEWLWRVLPVMEQLPTVAPRKMQASCCKSSQVISRENLFCFAFYLKSPNF